jgi:hypothetical protein
MKAEQSQKGFEFYYTVSDEQIREHRGRSMKEIFNWLESTFRFVNKLQTVEEKERANKIRKGEF